MAIVCACLKHFLFFFPQLLRCVLCTWLLLITEPLFERAALVAVNCSDLFRRQSRYYLVKELVFVLWECFLFTTDACYCYAKSSIVLRCQEVFAIHSQLCFAWWGTSLELLNGWCDSGNCSWNFHMWCHAPRFPWTKVGTLFKACNTCEWTTQSVSTGSLGNGHDMACVFALKGKIPKTLFKASRALRRTTCSVFAGIF